MPKHNGPYPTLGPRTAGSITQNTNPNTQAYARLAPSKRDEYAPTGRLDYNLTDRRRISGTYYWQRIISRPDFLNSSEPAFPGFPNEGDQTSFRKTGSLSVRSTLSSALVNEAKFGFQSSPVDFYSDLGIDSFRNQNGYAVTLGFDLSNAHVLNAPNKRNTPSWSLENSLSWLNGNHSIKLGATFMNVTNISDSWNIAPTVTLGIDQTNDPANAMFTTANFAGASTANLADARALYALLTGRVTAINGTARQNVATGEYVYVGGLEQRAGMKEFGVYAQDSWRVTPTLTLNGGLRWPNVVYLDCELPRTRRQLDDPEAFLEDHDGARIVLDEIHRLTNPAEIRKIAADLAGWSRVPQYLFRSPHLHSHSLTSRQFLPRAVGRCSRGTMCGFGCRIDRGRPGPGGRAGT